MSETSAPGEVDATKPCKVCGEAIKTTAKKCIHCDSYQDWRAYLNFGSTCVVAFSCSFFSAYGGCASHCRNGHT